MGVTSVVTGVDVCFAITSEYDVYTWGGGGVGRQGLNPRDGNKNCDPVIQLLEPTIVVDLQGEEVAHVREGAHGIAIGGGDCFVWGDGDAGQLGLGDLEHHHVIAVNKAFLR